MSRKISWTYTVANEDGVVANNLTTEQAGAIVGVAAHSITVLVLNEEASGRQKPHNGYYLSRQPIRTKVMDEWDNYVGRLNKALRRA